MRCVLLLDSSYCRPPPHDAWAGGSFGAIAHGLLRPGCGRRAWPDSPIVAGHASYPGGTTKFARHGVSCANPRKTSPGATPPAVLSRKNSPSAPQNADFEPFFVCRANFFALVSAPGRAGRTFSRTEHGHVPTLKPITPLQPLMQASMKPPAPLLALEQQPLKPTTPLQPKNAPKTPISRPQRRWRFQLGLGLREQRRWRFQPHAQTSEQRRQGFHARDFRCRWAAAEPEPNKRRT